ncbi:hypothetical protein C0Q44_28135 [Paenibacillus sp. PCH8]|uniref:hypothetical protein n=1 Tax=Paenibacillus sp. PCH8 TaxID=2066524 RepID=UPI000CF9B80D|nr:hypothetical protein [Paenibacillus sp. PCH8]PQP80285.1 hypothetical protein C0Q44_28135 [Paenibacillus sp. PCH8]
MNGEMNDVSVMLQHIRNEKINIELSQKEGFSFNPNKKSINMPYSVDLGKPESVHILAHEFGHYLQRNRYSSLTYPASVMRGMANKGHLVPSCYIFLEEIDAWVRGFALCKRIGVSTKGYLGSVLKPLGSYLKPIYRNVFITIKKVISLYLISFTITKILKISSEKDIPPNLPTFLKDDMLLFWSEIQNYTLDAHFTLAIFNVLIIIYFFGRILRFLKSLMEV